jgi:cobaltochelatase CobT
MRAIAGEPELEVALRCRQAGLCRQSMPACPTCPSDATADDLMRDPRHRRFHGAAACLPQQAGPRPRPAGRQPARAIYEAVEQARVESLGARRMPGMADNLGHDRRRFANNLADVTEREEAPLPKKPLR